MKLRKSDQSGSIIVSILIVTIFLTSLVLSMMVIANATLVRARSRVMLLQAQYSAESGADAAIAQFNNGNESYSGSNAEVTVLTASNLYRSTFSSTVTAGSSGREKIITSIGRVYSPSSSSVAKYSRKIEVVAQRTSSSVVASGIVARNIIQIASSVKDIYAKDVYVNNYLQMDKNTNTLHSETVTAAGKNTSASNCSLTGPGSFVKPTTFTTPGQTKTIIKTAYNNCITPPGNTSNSDFTVSVNQNNINKIQSTYIPWSQYMDNSYLNAGSCSDWTTGGSTRTIPSSVGNAKKTHYPDSASNVSTSCGTSGDLDLGNNVRYNITDNVHIRANLCATNGCNPTFYNPDSTPKYIFVEGTIKFLGVTSVAGSGPIILVSYGADPTSLSSACPLGGAVYLGNSGSFVVNAPNIYFLSSNGLCFDKTKFSGDPPNYTSFGGLSAKNIYISTNSGSPHDPTLSTTFPLEYVPIDLTWHATRYRRI